MLEIALEQLIQRIQRIEPTSEQDAKHIAAHLIVAFLVEPQQLSDETIQGIIELMPR